MTDETTPKTAYDHLWDAPEDTREDKRYGTSEVLYAMKAYARQVAQQVRQQCADSANKYDSSPLVSKESILSVDIEQFIK